jgi:hypothetical protein
MRRFVLAAAAVLLLGAASPADEVKRIVATPDPAGFNYFEVKAELGPEGFKQLTDQVSQALLGPEDPGGGRDLTRSPCWTRRQAEIMGGLLLANLSPSLEAYGADQRAARGALSRLEGFRPRLAAGEDVGPPYDGALKQLRAAAASGDPRKAELLRRAAQDQIVRQHLGAVWGHGSWAGPLSTNVVKYLEPILSVEVCEVDQANTAWLKAEIRDHGWFTISAYGAQADNQAWLLVQHADHDRDFQRQTLKLLEGLLASRGTSPKNYAYLYDRLAVADDRPQRYATQGGCTTAGAWRPYPVEDMPHVDELRAAVGLGPFAEYAAQFRDSCA